MSVVKTDHVTEHTAGAGVAVDVALTASAGLTSPGLIHAPAGINFGGHTLSNYDEGTWTPTFLGSSTRGAFVYAENDGDWRRTGNIVVLNGTLIVSSVSIAASGTLFIGGSPFGCTARSTGTISQIGSINFGGSYTQAGVRFNAGDSTMQLFSCGSNMGANSTPASSIIAGSVLIFSLTLFV